MSLDGKENRGDFTNESQGADAQSVGLRLEDLTDTFEAKLEELEVQPEATLLFN